MRSLSLGVFVAVVAFGAVSPGAQRGPADVEWRQYSGDNGSTKYSPLAQITKDNVARLRIAWRRPQVDPSLLEQNPKLRPGNNFRSTPIMVGGVLYASNGVGLVEAFEPRGSSSKDARALTAERHGSREERAARHVVRRPQAARSARSSRASIPSTPR